jgi:lysophospholipase L1-like esterase
MDTHAALRYVALGDSYTIGTAVAEAERWPNQLTARIDALRLVGNVAVNGFTSRDLIVHELPALAALRPNVVSVLIGVNDVVQGISDDAYRANVATILDELLERLPAHRIVCVATPDYTRTPRGAEYGDPDRQRARIVDVNEILRRSCERRGVAFVAEPFAISSLASVDPSLVASDGLHPSGEQYRRWTDAVEPVVRVLLEA